VPMFAGEAYPASMATGAFLEAMDDDFNTPEAIAVLQGLARELDSERAANPEGPRVKQLGSELRALGGVLGILLEDPARFLQSAAAPSGIGRDGAPRLPDLTDAEIEARIAARLKARKAKNWAESDRIRDELAAGGVLLEDQPGGVTAWRRG
jgi:cysteinyl-tRNA synthetase